MTWDETEIFASSRKRANAIREAMSETPNSEALAAQKDRLRLTYSSRATEPMSEDGLLELLAHVRAKNARLGVTGILLYVEPTFLQVLEGDREVVESLYGEIESDLRHTEPRVLLREEAIERAFGDWTMGLLRIDPDKLDAIDGLNAFLRDRPANTETCDDELRVHKILEQFRSGRWRREIEG